MYLHCYGVVDFHPVIDDLDLPPQNRRHYHFSKALAEAVGRMLFAVEVNDLPAQAVKLVKERLFDVVAFVEGEELGIISLSHWSSSFSLLRSICQA